MNLVRLQAYVNNPDDNKKKLLYDVRKKGDVYFRSGDIVVMDKYGWLYFKVGHSLGFFS